MKSQQVNADQCYMRSLFFLILIISLCLGTSGFAIEPGYVLDSNTAVFEGVQQTYLISPPKDFQMITEKAVADGYSMAFISNQEYYDSALLIIGVTIFSTDDVTMADLILSDTTEMRTYYGDDLEIRGVDSVRNFEGKSLETIYLDDKTSFIPNVMVSYFDGIDEIIIFELVIDPKGLPRFMAVNLFTSFIAYFKTLPKRAMPGVEED